VATSAACWTRPARCVWGVLGVWVCVLCATPPHSNRQAAAAPTLHSSNTHSALCVCCWRLGGGG
jgi:hypothetical protein